MQLYDLALDYKDYKWLDRLREIFKDEIIINDEKFTKESLRAILNHNKKLHTFLDYKEQLKYTLDDYERLEQLYNLLPIDLKFNAEIVLKIIDFL